MEVKGMQPRRIRIRSVLHPLTCDLKQGVVVDYDSCCLERPTTGKRSCRQCGVAVAVGEVLMLRYCVNIVKVGLLESGLRWFFFSNLPDSEFADLLRGCLSCLCLGAGVLVVALLTFLE